MEMLSVNTCRALRDGNVRNHSELYSGQSSDSGAQSTSVSMKVGSFFPFQSGNHETE